MKTKKVLTCLVAVAVLLVMVSASSLTVSATQPGTAVFSAGDLTASAGGTVVAELTLKGSSITAFQGVLLYDRDVFTLEKVEKTSPLKGLTVFGEKAGVFENGSFIYAHAQGIDMDGPVLKFTFKVDSGAKNGNYPLSIVDTKAYDAKSTDLKTSVSSAGSVTVSGGSGQKGTPDKVPTNPNPPAVMPPNLPSPNQDPQDPNPQTNPPGPDDPAIQNPDDPTASGIPGDPEGSVPRKEPPVMVRPAEPPVDDSEGVPASSPLFGGSILLYVIIALGVLVVVGIVVVIVVTRKKNRRIG